MSKESAVITSESGSHENQKNRDDVDSFEANGKTYMYFPQKLELLFKNLRLICIRKSQMKEINKHDLKPYKKLTHLDLDDNDIDVLDNDLFQFNQGMELISFERNKIFHIGNQIFDNLSKLKEIWLSLNICINMNGLDIENKVILIDIARRNCQNSEYLAFDNELRQLENTSACTFSESLSKYEQMVKDLGFKFQTSKVHRSQHLKERIADINKSDHYQICKLNSKIISIEKSFEDFKVEILKVVDNKIMHNSVNTTDCTATPKESDNKILIYLFFTILISLQLVLIFYIILILQCIVVR